MPSVNPPYELPPEVAVEIASYLRSSLFAPLAQSQVSNVIEPTAERLLPIASELQDVYHQIDLLEVLISRVSENIKQMASKVERTELALRREERALNDGKPTAMWKEQEKVHVFSAREYVENGRLLDRP